MRKVCVIKIFFIVGVTLVFALIAGVLFIDRASEEVTVANPNNPIVQSDPSNPEITNFEECVNAGNPVMESYPRQCQTKDGKNFREEIEDNEGSTCIVTGCSSHICSDRDVNTTCEEKEEYICYRSALCEMQDSDICGWTMTEELTACLDRFTRNSASIQMENPPVIDENVEGDDVNTTSVNVKDRSISWGYENASGRTIDTVILHSSYNSLGGDEYDVKKIIDIYKQYEVGAHYIIDRNGTIHQLVKEKDIAYHAGVSSLPDKRTNVNQVSIGIELVNNMSDAFTIDQYIAVNALIKDIRQRYTIKYVLGHDDIAPGRKTDPWNMDWDNIATK